MTPLDMMVQVNVIAATPTEDSAKVLGEHIMGLGEAGSYLNVFKEPKISAEDDDEYKVVVTLFILPKELNDTLVILDGVKAGYTTPHETMIFSDAILQNIRIHPVMGMMGGTEATNNVIEYLMNKVQEQTKAIATLEAEASEQGRQFVKIAQILAGHQERYESMQSYIHSYINLTAMSKIVTALAEEVDPDLLDDFPLVIVH